MKKYIYVIISLIVGMLLGWLLFGGSEQEHTHEHESSQMQEDSQMWTCSMHPNVRKEEPGDCPICGMDLIPVKSQSDNDFGGITFTDSEIRVSDIQTVKIGKSSSENRIRLNGKIEYDERMIYTQTAHYPGRIEDLYVNYTGAKVEKGQPIAKLYSPALALAQKELFKAREMKDDNPELYNSVIKKLKLWKLKDSQIQKILESNEVIEYFDIRADLSGYITNLKVREGDHLMEGGAIYDIAGLSKLWAVFEAYESELSDINMGDEIQFTVPAVPGKTFSGRVSYIDPMLDKKTRTSKVRVNISNYQNRLKPEMLAVGNIISHTGSESLSVPKSAVLWTGERSIVYVATDEKNTFRATEVQIGTLAGDSYPVLSGLNPGDEVVVNGAFTVDAAAQIAGKKSMMTASNVIPDTPGHDEIGHPESHPESQESPASHTLDAYFTIKDALVNDDFKKAIATAKKAENLPENINTAMQKLGKAKDIEQAREIFYDLSQQVIKLAKSSKNEKEYYILRCPMAKDGKGADWLSKEEKVLNPYFGSSMLKCGFKKEVVR